MKRKLVDVFLSDTLLLAFAAFVLLLFVAMLMQPKHVIGLEEPNLAVLVLETAICTFTLVFAVVRIVRNIRKGRQSVL